MVKRWEYHIVWLSGNTGADTDDNETLNSLGQQGWELVAVTEYGWEFDSGDSEYNAGDRVAGAGGNCAAYFKREYEQYGVT